MTESKVIKRNGEVVRFDRKKIESAILKAMKYGSGILKEDIAEKISKEIEFESKNENSVTIYQIETMVYNKLLNHKQELTAKAYEGYRAVQSYKRENDPLIESVMGLVNLTNKEVMLENANKQAELVATQRDLIAGEISKAISKNYLIPAHLVQANDNGLIKLHDLDYYLNGIYNCELINLEDMLQNGTVINKKKIRKPKSLRTAMTIATQISAQVSSSTYGGQTMTLSHLAPFVRISKERIIEKYKHLKEVLGIDEFNKMVDTELKAEIKDSVQTFNYQINTISSTNGQTPFISLAMYISEDEEYREETAMLIEEFLKQRIDGMENEYGIKTTQTFPKLLYFLDEDNIKEDSEYFYLTKLAAESVAKRLSPDFISVKKMKELYGLAFPCMGCRAFLTPHINPDTGKYDMYGRGNLGVTTVNLVDVALSCDKTEEDFFDILEKRLELCKEMGILRYEKMKGIKAKTAPILWQHGAIARLNPEDDIIKAIDDRKFTVSIGYCGLHETVKYMTGKSLSEGQGTEFGLKIMQYLDDYKDKVKKETGLMWAIYGTPSESTAGWFSEKVKSRFGIIEGITDKGWITNSYHIDIQEKINAFDKLRIEQKFAEHSLGGTITYIEVPNMLNNIEVVIQLVQYMYDNNIYAEINTESDTCSTCGFNGVIGVNEDGLTWVCPQCGESDQDKLSVVRRTCGYISETKWCSSRMLDIINRVKHL